MEVPQPNSERIKMTKISKKSQITLVELPPTQFGIYNGDINYDIYTQFRLPARAIHVLEAILQAEGFENIQSINPMYHGSKGRLTEDNEKRIFDSDVLCISSITRTSPQSMELSRRFKSHNPSGIVIAGGFDPHFRTEEWLEEGKADIVVRGEGEKTFSKLMKMLTQDSSGLAGIAGLAFKDGKGIQQTGLSEPLTPQELSMLPHPYYDIKTQRGLGTTVIETTRGCPNACDFCSVTEFYGRRYRARSLDYVIEGLERIRNMGRMIFYTDDNFAVSPSRTIELLERIIDRGLVRRGSSAQVSVKVSENTKVLELLKKAKIDVLYVGIESINEDTLQSFNKPYSATQNKMSIKKLREMGFWVHGMMMLGGDGDTAETLKETEDWIKQNLDSVQLFSPTPFQGTGFYKRLKGENRIITEDFSLYDGQNVVIRPKNLSPFELQRTIYKMYESFYSFGESWKRWKTSPKRGSSFKLYLYNHLLGWKRNMLYNPQAKKHLEFLKSVS